MHTDIVDLREFYQSSIGQVARRMIRRRIRQVWPSGKGMTMAGIGYATPYLRPYLNEAERVLALMPAPQGVTAWPREGPGLTALVEETELPLADLSIDRVLLVHGLEGSEQLRALLREIWRVLSGGGRLLAVVPNRRGLWARADRTPLGHGYPYSASQLKRLLRDALFVPERTDYALFIPPVKSRFSLAWAPAWEEVGERWFKAIAGVTMVEASKQVYAGLGRRATPTPRRLVLPAPEDAAPARAGVESQSSATNKEALL
ncbi:MAG: methyltransferase domain-containing protein [Azospirillum sp.]|nr:methyltransferase domain-containing protein [Azospirillum sp.]